MLNYVHLRSNERQAEGICLSLDLTFACNFSKFDAS